MRLALTVSAAVMALSVPALAQEAAAPAAQAQVQAQAPMAGQFTRAELTTFHAAMERVTPIAQAANGAPSADQQAQMAAAIEAEGLTVDRFNAISAAVAGDPVLQARLAVIAAPAPAAGSPAASVTDQEVQAAARATAQIRDLGIQGTPTAEQAEAMGAAVQSAGLTIERFNEIATAARSADQLRARLALAEARMSASEG
ncbi:DUF4168 domain-containing protein [Brevundimonas sp. 2R-24]|uniref:DUF4168 domain-containing protein n=1 Tax=Peiella sedimenti TaxID=3061083 RepID=A0ABT8SMZ2_9CAUL|nr:DUF4168 domain-containing protein [Caulobacteraceae bacterium XZ-24]